VVTTGRIPLHLLLFLLHHLNLLRRSKNFLLDIQSHPVQGEALTHSYYFEWPFASTHCSCHSLGFSLSSVDTEQASYHSVCRGACFAALLVLSVIAPMESKLLLENI
jgi:hypothetical protein